MEALWVFFGKEVQAYLPWCLWPVLVAWINVRSSSSPLPRKLFQERGSHLYPESFRRGFCFSSTSSVAWSTASEVLCEDCLKPVLPPIPCTRYTHLSITVVLTVWPPNCKSSVLEVTSYSQFKDQWCKVEAAHFFRKGSDSKHFQLWELCGLQCTSVTLPQSVHKHTGMAVLQDTDYWSSQWVTNHCFATSCGDVAVHL